MKENDPRPHILVVDDSPEILSLKDDILESEGFRVSTLLRRETGVSEVMEMEPDLLVMDYVAQEASSLMYDIATDLRTRQLPILLCTGAIREVEAILPQLDELGVRVIFKPFDIGDLIAVVRESMCLSADPDMS